MCALVLTNMDTVAQAPKASGGHILSHSCQTIVQLRKGRGEERVAKLLDSPGKHHVQCHRTL